MDTKHDHLRRLPEVWLPDPIFFITACVAQREPRLANDVFHDIAVEVWRNCEQHYGWKVGQYVIMPDHIHFFASAAPTARPLSVFVGRWKEWTTKYLARRHAAPTPLWQAEFFDHVLRSSESYEEKSTYVLNNPVRAGLVQEAHDWKYQGTLTRLVVD
ncbi:MAG: hypothetical protein FJ304_22720 [Planctomycetes bacterium]|nr:hypothetical protein [Planctomycetota bacterium]